MPNGKRWKLADFFKPPTEPPTEPTVFEIPYGLPTKIWKEQIGEITPEYAPLQPGRIEVETEKGKTMEFDLKPDNTLWLKGVQVGSVNPETREIATRKLTGAEQAKITGLWAEVLTGVLAPFKVTGMGIKETLTGEPWSPVQKLLRQRWSEELEKLPEDLSREERQEAALKLKERYEPKILALSPAWEREKIIEYEEQPWWLQLLWESPAWAALGVTGISGISARAALAPVAAKPGIVGVAAKVARVGLYPLSKVEQAIAYPIQKALTPIIKRNIASGFHKWLVSQGIKISPQTEKAILKLYTTPVATKLGGGAIKYGELTKLYGQKAVMLFEAKGMTADVARAIATHAKTIGDKTLLKQANRLAAELTKLGKATVAVESLQEKLAVKFFNSYAAAGGQVTADTGYTVAKAAAVEAEKYFSMFYQTNVALTGASQSTNTLVVDTILPGIFDLPRATITPELIASFVTKGAVLSIPRGLIGQLKNLGYTAETIKAMKPEEAWANLFSIAAPEVEEPAVRPEVPTPEVAPAVPEVTPVTPEVKLQEAWDAASVKERGYIAHISGVSATIAERKTWDELTPKQQSLIIKRGVTPKVAIPKVEVPTVQGLVDKGKVEFDRLADTGRVAPFGGDVVEKQTTNELKAVVEGQKPIALIAGVSIAEARKLGLVVKRVALKGEKITDLVDAYAAYKKGNTAAFDKLSNVFTKQVTGELKGAEMDVALGEALGYSEADIAKYLQQAHGSYEEFVKVAKPREPAGVPQPKVRLTALEKLRATSIGKLKQAQIKKLDVRETVSKVKALNKRIEKLPLRLKADARAVTKDFDIAFRQNRTLKERAKLRKLVKQLEAEGKEVNVSQHTLDLAYKTPLKNLTAQQVDAIHDDLDALVNQGLKEMRDMREARDVSLEETVDKLVEHMGIPPKDPAIITRETLKLKRWQKIVDVAQSFLMRTYFVKNILLMGDDYDEGGLLQRTFYNSVDRATNEKLSDTIAYHEELKAFMAKWDISAKKVLHVEKELMPGIALTPSTRMGVFLAARDHDAALHMKYGTKIDEKIATDVINQMTPDEAALAEYLHDVFNDKERALKISEVKELVEGKSLKLVKDWFPIRLLYEADPQMEFPELMTWERDQRLGIRMTTEPGMATKFVKERTHKALQPIDLDALTIYERYIKESAHYIALAPVISDLRRIAKHPKFRAAFKAKLGRPALSVLETWIEDNARGQRLMPRNWAERVLRTARVNAVTAILGWSLTVAPKQFPSFVSGMAYFGVIPSLHGLAQCTSHPTETWNTIKAVSPQMRMRVMERELSLMKLTRNLEKRLTNRVTKREMFMMLVLLVDRYVVNSLWIGGYQDYLGKHPGELEAAEKYATDGVIKTQPFFNVKDTAELWRSGEISAALTIFTNQLNRYWNYYRFDIYGAAKAGKIGFGTVVKRVLLAFIIPALMISIISRSRPPKDAKDILTSLADMSLATIPVAGHWLTAGWKGFYGDSGIVTTEVLDKVQQASYYLSKGEWDKLALLMPELAGFITGVPTVQPKRTIKAMIDLASGKSDDWLELIWGSYTREKARKEEAEKKRETPGLFREPEGKFKIEDFLK